MEDATALEWRDATDADHEFLRHLMRVTVKDYLLKNPTMTEEACESRFDTISALPWRIVSMQGEDVGGMAVEIMSGQFYLAAIHVLPHRQNRGIGSLMLRHLIRQAAKERRMIFLEVMRVNTRAKRLYERHGFTFVADMPGENAILMKRNPPLLPPLNFSFLTQFFKRRKQ